MRKENKILFGAVLILLIAIVSFNFGGITGQFVKSGKVTNLYIDKSVVTAGEDTITIHVKPGSEGVEQEIDFYTADDNTRVAQGAADVCRDYKCFKEATIEFKIPGTWEGDYYVRVADKYYESIGKEKYVKAYFHVDPAQLPVGPKLHK